MLDVGDGHSLYYERCGTPGAKPAVFLHGGPGGHFTQPSLSVRSGALRRSVVRPAWLRQIRPHAGLEANTTWHLVADIERLRVLAGVDQWLVFGGSWGSTLALTYAQAHADRVTELVLRGIYMCTGPELNWFYQFGVSEMFPDKYERFLAPIPQAERGDMLTAYHRRLTTGALEDQIAAARAWSLFEGETITLLPDPETTAQHDNGHFALARVSKPIILSTTAGFSRVNCCAMRRNCGRFRNHRPWPLRHALPGPLCLGAP
jgi:proline iminopeptidase